MNSTEKIKELILRVLKIKYNRHAYCFFYGSALIGNARTFSDINIIVVSSVAIPPYREKFIFEGQSIDALIYDEESLNGAMHIARTTGQFALADAVIAAQILPDASIDSLKLKEIATRVKASGFSFETQVFQRQFITNILDDLLDCAVVHERNMLCVDLFKSTVDLLLIGGGAGICNGKHAACRLMVIDAPLQKQLDSAMIAALAEDTGPLIRIATMVLSQIGGPLREGFKMNCPPAPRVGLPVL